MRRALVFVAAFAATFLIAANLTACDWGPKLDLPKAPWYGGSSYWDRFPKTKAAGWSDENFFPLGIWYGAPGNDTEAQYDKQLANFYTEGINGTGDVIARNGMFCVCRPGDMSGASWVGNFLDDEVDGRYDSNRQAGFDLMASDKASADAANPDGFDYANYTGSVENVWYGQADQERFVNGYTDAVSTDLYFATSKWWCDPNNANWWSLISAQPPFASCRHATPYGRQMDGLQTRDDADGQRQALFNFIDVGGIDNFTPPEVVKGAAMQSILHGAGGLVWYNQSWAPGCVSGAVIRDTERGSGCFTGQVAALRDVVNDIRHMAQIVNSQPYVYSWGSGIETRTWQKYGYVWTLAMTDGTTGAKTFTAPAGTEGDVKELSSGDNFADANSGTTVGTSDTFTVNYSSNDEYHLFRRKITG